MKYNGREVEDFTIGVQLGADKVSEKLEEFKDNEKFVANMLRQNNVKGWDYAESPVDDLVLIIPSDDDIESVNRLFNDVNKLFDKTIIAILYSDFCKNGHNQEEITECLNITLYEK